MLKGKSKKKVFYVYVYMDPRKPGQFKYDKFTFDHEPFYVGKGNGDRISKHMYIASKKPKYPKHKRILEIYKDTKQEPIIVKVKSNLNDDEAMNLEHKLITLMGRIDIGTGILTNMTNGGYTGYVKTPKDIRLKEKKRVNDFLNKMIGIWGKEKITAYNYMSKAFMGVMGKKPIHLMELMKYTKTKSVKELNSVFEKLLNCAVKNEDILEI